MQFQSYDLAVFGGGIIGLATAAQLVERYPKCKVVILEKEPAIAQHQTGHNSGVIHAGLYYAPGSKKASLCWTGSQLLRRFCETHSIEYQTCGKVVVATQTSQLENLDELKKRGDANGVEGLRIIGQEQLRELEPHASGIKALYSPNTAIVDYSKIAEALANNVKSGGGEIFTQTKIFQVHKDGTDFQIETSRGDLQTRYILNCAGLHADQLAKSMGVKLDLRIIPFRGEFFILKPDRARLVNGLIYPVPQPNLPFLGVHFTKRINGATEVGPNAVLAFAREAYKKTDFDMREMLGIGAFPGFWKLVGKHWLTGLKEERQSLIKKFFARSLQSLVPEIQTTDLVHPYSGVRAQAVSRKGELLQDFKIARARGSIHVLNAPSPAATACLAIGKHIVEAATEMFNLDP